MSEIEKYKEALDQTRSDIGWVLESLGLIDSCIERMDEFDSPYNSWMLQAMIKQLVDVLKSAMENTSLEKATTTG